MKKKLVFGLVVFGTLALTACSNDTSKQSINAVGSSALQPLVEAGAEQYMSENPGEIINVQGGGSGTGLSQVQTGAVEIGNSDLFAEEKSGINAAKLVDHRVAVVGITPIVNKKVGIKNISLSDLRKIFTGEITNWKQLGGANQKVVLLNRATGSGTRATFERWVMDGKEAKKSQEQDSTGMVRQIVGSTPGAISYVAFSYVTSEVQTLSIDGVKPTEKNVETNKWQIWSYEHMYTKGQPQGVTKKFLSYMLSKKTQAKLVPKLGYISIHDMQVTRDASGKVQEQ